MSDGDRVSPRDAISHWLETTKTRSLLPQGHREYRTDRQHTRRKEERSEDHRAAQYLADGSCMTSRRPADTRHPRQIRISDTSERLREADTNAHMVHLLEHHSPRRKIDPTMKRRQVLRATQESILEPAASVDLRAHTDRHPMASEYDSKYDKGLEPSERAPETVQPEISHSAQALYERRPRHKTRKDRYEPKQSRAAGIEVERKHDHEELAPRGKKRKRKEKSGAAVMQNFEAQNISQDRVTLRPNTSLGIFRNGKASFPVKRRPLPDLAFSELEFLNLRRNRAQEDEERRHHRMMSKMAQQDTEMSRYFNSRPDGPRKPANKTAKRDREKNTAHSINYEVDPGIDDPRKQFLGFGSRGPNSSASPLKSQEQYRTPSLNTRPIRKAPSPTPSNSYFTWSRSARSRASLKSSAVRKREPTSRGHRGGFSPLHHRRQSMRLEKPRRSLTRGISMSDPTTHGEEDLPSHHSIISRPNGHQVEVSKAKQGGSDTLTKEYSNDLEGDAEKRIKQSSNIQLAMNPTVRYRDFAQQTTPQESPEETPRRQSKIDPSPTVKDTRLGPGLRDSDASKGEKLDLADDQVSGVDSLPPTRNALTPKRDDAAQHTVDNRGFSQEQQASYHAEGNDQTAGAEDNSRSPDAQIDVPRQEPIISEHVYVDSETYPSRSVHDREATVLSDSDRASTLRLPTTSASAKFTLPSFGQLRQRTAKGHPKIVNGYGGLFTRQLNGSRLSSVAHHHEQSGSTQKVQDRRLQQPFLSTLESLRDQQPNQSQRKESQDTSGLHTLPTTLPYNSDRPANRNLNMYDTPRDHMPPTPQSELVYEDTLDTESRHVPVLPFGQNVRHTNAAPFHDSTTHYMNLQLGSPALKRRQASVDVPLGRHDQPHLAFAAQHHDARLQNFWTPNKLY